MSRNETLPSRGGLPTTRAGQECMTVHDRDETRWTSAALDFAATKTVDARPPSTVPILAPGELAAERAAQLAIRTSIAEATNLVVRFLAVLLIEAAPVANARAAACREKRISRSAASCARRRATAEYLATPEGQAEEAMRQVCYWEGIDANIAHHNARILRQSKLSEKHGARVPSRGLVPARYACDLAGVCADTLNAAIANGRVLVYDYYGGTPYFYKSSIEIYARRVEAQ